MGLNEQSGQFKKNMNDANKAVNDAQKSVGELASSMQDNVFFSRDFADEAKRASKELYGASLNATETTKAFRDVAKAAAGISDDLDKVVSGQASLNDLAKKKAALDKAGQGLNREKKSFLTSQLKDEDKVNKIMGGQLDASKALSDARKSGVIENDKLLGAAQEMYMLFKGQGGELKNAKEAMGGMMKRAKNIAGSVGVFKGGLGLKEVGGAIDGALKKIGAGGIAEKLNIKGAVSDAQQYAAELTNGGESALGLGGRLKVAGKMAAGMGANLTAALGPLGLITAAINGIIKIFKFFFGQVMELDKEIGNTADTLGISYNQSQKLSMEAAKQADYAAGEMVLRKEIVASQVKLNQQFGQTIVFSEQMADDFARTTKFLNLSEEAAAGFADASLETGKSIRSLQVDVVGVTQELNSQNGLAMSQKEIMEGVAKATDAQFLMAGGSAKELAKQVFEAKKLGMEMSDLEKIGGNLLDFESSINAEMEAELLTGKQLNLEKARQAALDGDLGTLAQEISKNIGDSADFAAMNVMQQEAIAKAVGMTRQELAGSLREQEQMAAVSAALGGDFKNLNEAQEKYNELAKSGQLTEAQKQQLAEAGLATQMESASIEEIKEDTQAAVFEKLQNEILPAMGDFRDIAIQVSDKFMKIMTTVMGIIGQIKEFLKPIIEMVRDTFAEIGEKANELFGDVGGISGVFEFIGGVLTDVIAYQLEIFMGFVDMIMNQVKGIMDIFTGIGEVISGIATGEFDKVMGGLAKIGDGIARFFLAPIERFINAFISGVNFIIKQINKIPAISIPTIGEYDMMGAVGLAEGGVVMPRPGGTSAIIGEGGEAEMVLPLSKANAMGFGGGGQSNAQLQREMQQVNKNLQMLIAAVEQGGDVFIDGAKVGKSLVLATSNLGT